MRMSLRVQKQNTLGVSENCCDYVVQKVALIPLDTGRKRKLKVHKEFRGRAERLLNIFIFLTHLFPIYLSLPPENIRKP